MRQEHWIEPSGKSYIPRKYIFFYAIGDQHVSDFDSSITVHTLCQWYVMSVSIRDNLPTVISDYSGFTTNRLWTIITQHLSARETTYVVSYNLAYQLTLTEFWATIGRGILLRGDPIVEDAPTVIRCEYGSQKLVILDLLNYYSIPLDQIALDAGYPVRSRGFHAQGADGNTDYCRERVYAMSAIMSILGNMLASHKLGSLKCTAASQAWEVWRHKYYDMSLHELCHNDSGDEPAYRIRCNNRILVHNRQEVLDIERLAYYGGRCECLRLGRVNNEVFQVDCNSMYPYCMAGMYMPTQYSSLEDRPHIGSLRDMLNTGCVIASVRLRSHTNDYPVRVDNRVIHARGVVDTVLSTPELATAMAAGDILDVHRAVYYVKGMPFTHYVADIYNLRLAAKQRGDRATASLCKMLLNSLYGKFASYNSRWEAAPNITPPADYCTFWAADPDTGELHYYRSIGWAVSKRIRTEEWIDSCPAIAGHVTAYARCLMQYYVDLAGDGNVYYYDADCLHCNHDGVNNLATHGLLDDTKIGKLRTVAIYPNAYYWGPRDYQLGERRIHAGVNPLIEPLADGTYLQTSRQGLQTILRSRPKPYVQYTERKYRFKRDYYLGRVDEEGWVRPLVMSDGNVVPF